MLACWSHLVDPTTTTTDCSSRLANGKREKRKNDDRPNTKDKIQDKDTVHDDAHASFA